MENGALTQFTLLADIAEGTHDMTPGMTYEADGAITERFLLMKRGCAFCCVEFGK